MFLSYCQITFLIPSRITKSSNKFISECTGISFLSPLHSLHDFKFQTLFLLQISNATFFFTVSYTTLIITSQTCSKITYTLFTRIQPRSWALSVVRTFPFVRASTADQMSLSLWKEKLECRAVFYAEEKLTSQKTMIHMYTLHSSRKSIKAVKIIIVGPH